MLSAVCVFSLLSWVYLDLGSDQVRGAQRVGLLQVIRKNWSAEQIRFFAGYLFLSNNPTIFACTYLTNHHNFSSYFLLTRYWTCRRKTLHIPLTLNLLISRQAFSLSAHTTHRRGCTLQLTITLPHKMASATALAGDTLSAEQTSLKKTVSWECSQCVAYMRTSIH